MRSIRPKARSPKRTAASRRRRTATARACGLARRPTEGMPWPKLCTTRMGGRATAARDMSVVAVREEPTGDQTGPSARDATWSDRARAHPPCDACDEPPPSCARAAWIVHSPSVGARPRTIGPPRPVAIPRGHPGEAGLVQVALHGIDAFQRIVPSRHGPVAQAAFLPIVVQRMHEQREDPDYMQARVLAVLVRAQFQAPDLAHDIGFLARILRSRVPRRAARIDVALGDAPAAGRCGRDQHDAPAVVDAQQRHAARLLDGMHAGCELHAQGGLPPAE